MGLLNDLFGMRDNGQSDMFHHEGDMDEEESGEIRNKGHKSDISLVHEDARYERSLEQVEQELYQGSKFSKLSFILHLLHLKCMYGWSIKSFNILLQLLGFCFCPNHPIPIIMV